MNETSTNVGKNTCAKDVDCMRMLRKRLGKTLDQVAKETGLTLNGVHMIESGRRMPRVDTARRIARALGVGLDALSFAAENGTGAREQRAPVSGPGARSAS